MPSQRLSRRAFLSAAGITAATAALPVLQGSYGLLPAASAADSPTQTNLQHLVNMRFGMFNHFNMGTFTDEEWATPNQDPARFAPTAVTCGQWAAAAAAAKMSYGVLTTKHHDGFCLWPSAYNTYNVANSSYRQDIVAQYVAAFRAHGLKVGLYFSIWDRSNNVQAYDTRHGVSTTNAIAPAAVAYVLNQLRELLTNYGTIDLLVTDGYSWQMGQQAVSYQQVRGLVKSLQPNIVMIDHAGISQPFVGDAIMFEEPLGVTAPTGNTYAALQGQTISNGWFWHPSTPTTDPMSQASILAHLADLEPKWTSLILNCPPNRDGVLDTNIVNRLAEVGAAWSPNTSRPALPTQPLRAEYPITPVNAYTTGFHVGEGPLSAIDGRSDKDFETCWSTWSLDLPQSITIDLGGVWSSVSTLEYLPKQWNRANSTDGDITSYAVFTSTDGVVFTQVAAGGWAGDATTKLAEWPAQNVGFIRLLVNDATGRYANVSGLRVGGRSAVPQLLAQFPEPSTAYRLVARHSGKVVEVADLATANGTTVHQRAWVNGANQQWTFISTGDGFFKICGVQSGKLLEVAGLSRDDGGNVGLWADANAPQQHWAATPIGDGYYLMTNRLSGKALNVSGASTDDGAGINQWEYHSVAEQQWQIIPS